MSTQIYRGRPCKHGHVGNRYKCNNHCVDCQRETNRWRRPAPVAKPVSRFIPGMTWYIPGNLQ